MCGTVGPLHKHGMCASLAVTSRKACLHMYISEVKPNTNSLSALIPVFVLSSHSRFCGCLLMYLDFMLPDHHPLSLPADLNLSLFTSIAILARIIIVKFSDLQDTNH